MEDAGVEPVTGLAQLGVVVYGSGGSKGAVVASPGGDQGSA